MISENSDNHLARVEGNVRDVGYEFYFWRKGDPIIFNVHNSPSFQRMHMATIVMSGGAYSMKRVLPARNFCRSRPPVHEQSWLSEG